MARILVVDDESGIRDFLADTLTDSGHEVAQASDARDAMHKLEDNPFDLVILDLNMPGELGGLDVLRRSRAEWPQMQAIVLTAYGTVETAVEAMRIGAFDFLQKPIAGPDELRRLVSRALNWRARPRAATESAPPAEPVVGDFAGEPAPRSPVRRFLWELKRRHVYNVSVTYAAVAFIVLQVAQLVLPALPLPSWSYNVLVGLVIAGFPIALALGWIYDLTSNGLRRTRPGEPKRPDERRPGKAPEPHNRQGVAP